MIEATLATPADWDEVLPLVSSPQGDGWGLATRFPRGLAAALPPERQHLAVVRHRGRIVACGIRSVRTVLLAGETARIGYLAHLRRDPELPPLLAVAGLRAAFTCLAATRRADELPVDFTSILAGNHRARRLLEAGLPGVPRYHHRATYRTRVWAARTLARLAGQVAATGQGAVPPHPGLAMQPCPGPAAEMACLDGRAWGQLDDPGDRRQTRVTSLPPVLRWLRPVIDALRGLRGLPPVPRPGTDIPLHYLDRWGWRPGAATEALALASWLARRAPAGVLVAAGWCDDHPDAAALVAAAPAAEVITARWYTVGGTLPPGPWHMEAGSL